MGGVSGGVESETREGREGGSTGYGGDAVMSVGKYEEGTRVWSGGLVRTWWEVWQH